VTRTARPAPSRAGWREIVAMRGQEPAALRRRRTAALLAPVALTASTFVVFNWAVAAFGLRWGYITGFVFFWLVWCLGFSWWALGTRGIVEVFRDARPRLPTPTWVWIVLLAVPVVGGFATVWLPAAAAATLAVFVVATIIAVINATLEELFWRGVYARLFAGNLLLGWLYPAVAFAAWHVSPTSVLGSTAVVVLGALYIGLVYGYIALRTQSVRWTTVAHILVNLAGVNFALLVLGRL
jgi:uncharacterized protein